MSELPPFVIIVPKKVRDKDAYIREALLASQYLNDQQQDKVHATRAAPAAPLLNTEIYVCRNPHCACCKK